MATDLGMTSADTAIAADSQSWRKLAIKTVHALAVLAPFAYLGVLLPATIHELLGHDLWASLMGPRPLLTVFLPREEFDEQGLGIQLAATRFVTTMGLGLLFLLVAKKIRNPIASLAILLMSIQLLMEGTIYLFWNSVNPVPPDKIGMIIADTGMPWLRVVYIAVGGLMMLGFPWCLLAMLFHRLESWLGAGGQLHGRQRLAVLALIAALFGMPLFTFKWNLWGAGPGQIPNVVGAIAAALAAASLYRIRFRQTAFVPTRRTLLLSALTGYVLLGMSLAGIWFLHNGHRPVLELPY